MPMLFSGAGGSGSVNPNTRKRPARCGKDVVEEDEVPVPKKKSAPPARTNKRTNYKKMALHKYIEYRQVDP